jgi:uncharacterized OsmC-like protein
MLSYQIIAHSKYGGEAYAKANNSIVKFDASAGRKNELPNPAELLLTSLAACMLKNVERFSEILKFNYTEAQVEIEGERNDSPPYMSKIRYTLKVKSDMDEKKLNLLHKNILKFGTITNTLAKATDLQGTITFLH